MEIMQNKVADSGIITFNLESLLPTQVAVFDLKPFLFMELILKEKDYREALQQYAWDQFEGKDVILTCSTDAIIPVWAYMLAASYLQPVVARLVMGSEEEARKQLLLQSIQAMSTDEYAGQRVVIKGCGDIAIPPEAYAMITAKLKPVVRSIMYGEPCSTVPIYKQKVNV